MEQHKFELNSINFKFNFITDMGSDFVGIYTGDKAEDSFDEGSKSQLQPDGSLIDMEVIKSGKAKWSKIKGGGNSTVIMNQHKLLINPFFKSKTKDLIVYEF